MLKLSHFILFYAFFLFLGAFIFYELNYVEEKKRHIDVNRQIQQFIYRNRKCLKEENLYPYVDYFLDKSHTGLWHSVMSKGNISKWTFGQGLFFSTSLLTTVGYGTPTLISSYGKILCIFYTSIGLIFALIFQQLVHRRFIPIVYRSIGQFSLQFQLIRNISKYRSYSLAFFAVILLIITIFILIPTLILHHVYVPHWSLIELTYFTITTNHLIGFGDLMPCSGLHGQNRSTCSTIMTIYVVLQVLTAGLLSHVCWIYPSKRRQFFNQRRHSSDPLVSSPEKVFFDLT